MTLPRAYEDQLVERAKSDADAFGELYSAYFGQIYRFVYSRMRDQDAAEDVTSEVFFKALRAIGRYKPARSPVQRLALSDQRECHRRPLPRPQTGLEHR